MQDKGAVWRKSCNKHTCFQKCGVYSTPCISLVYLCFHSTWWTSNRRKQESFLLPKAIIVQFCQNICSYILFEYYILFSHNCILQICVLPLGQQHSHDQSSVRQLSLDFWGHLNWPWTPLSVYPHSLHLIFLLITDALIFFVSLNCTSLFSPLLALL